MFYKKEGFGSSFSFEVNWEYIRIKTRNLHAPL